MVTIVTYLAKVMSGRSECSINSQVQQLVLELIWSHRILNANPDEPKWASHVFSVQNVETIPGVCLTHTQPGPCVLRRQCLIPLSFWCCDDDVSVVVNPLTKHNVGYGCVFGPSFSVAVIS